MPAIDAVWEKLNQPIRLGYCNAGIIVEDEKVRRLEGEDGRRLEDRKVATVKCAPPLLNTLRCHK